MHDTPLFKFLPVPVYQSVYKKSYIDIFALGKHINLRVQITKNLGYLSPADGEIPERILGFDCFTPTSTVLQSIDVKHWKFLLLSQTYCTKQIMRISAVQRSNILYR